jgi:hypothetical protein
MDNNFVSFFVGRKTTMKCRPMMCEYLNQSFKTCSFGYEYQELDLTGSEY